jgi:hypothetical protein
MINPILQSVLTAFGVKYTILVGMLAEKDFKQEIL